MSDTPPTERSAEPLTDGEPDAPTQRRLSLATHVALVAGFVAMAVLMSVAGVFDRRLAPLWNPVILAGVTMSLVYVEPRPSLWWVSFAGALYGLVYAMLVLSAGALSGVEIHLGATDVLLRAVAIGTGLALLCGVLLRWLDPTTRTRRRKEG